MRSWQLQLTGTNQRQLTPEEKAKWEAQLNPTSEGENMYKVRKYVQFYYSFMMERHEFSSSQV